MTIRTRKFIRNHRLVAAGRGVVAVGDDSGADAVAGEFRAAAGDLLRCSRHRLGAAGDADRQLDGAARRLAQKSYPSRRARGCPVDGGISGAATSARKHHAHRAQRTQPAVPGDARKRVQTGAARRLDHARYRRRRADKARLRGHPGMLPAKGSGVAERIGEMPDLATETLLAPPPYPSSSRACARHPSGWTAQDSSRLRFRSSPADRPPASPDRSSPSTLRATAPRGRPNIVCRDR